MRELPDLEIPKELAESQHFMRLWKSVTSRPMTTREVDFAKLVQKQAYEDGLRDALEAVNTTSLPITLQAGMDSMARTAKDVCADAVRDLLTASQKEPQ